MSHAGFSDLKKSFFRPDLRGSGVITRLFCFAGRLLRPGELNLRKPVIVLSGLLIQRIIKNRGRDGCKLLLFISA